MTMTFVYNYTIPNLKFLSALHESIELLPNFPQDFYITSSNQVSIIFEQELTYDQLNILSNHITNYIPSAYYDTEYLTENINILVNKTDLTNYTPLSKYIYSKKPNTIVLKKISIISNLTGPLEKLTPVDTNPSYYFKVYDTINNQTLYEVNLNNQELEKIDCINLTNLPQDNTIIELQFKTSNSNYLVNLHAIFFEYVERTY